MKFARNLQFNISDKHLLRRGLSGLLALILVLNGFSVAASSAEIETEPADATEYVQETETTGESETTEPATTEPETTEPETTEPETTEPETTDPTDATDATDSTDATDATDATDPSGATDGAAAIDDGASDTEEIEPETFDFSAHVGMNATFNEAYGTDSFFDVLDTEPEAFWNAMSFGVSEFDENVIFRVMAYKVVASPYTSTDETTGEETILGYDYSLWYQVKIISDTPCEGFEDGYWVLQNYLEENPGADLLTLTTPEEPEETDPTDPTDPEETDPTDPTDPPATEPETTEPETTEPETTEPEDETVPSVSGGSGITVSSDSGIPKQATVAVTDHSATVGGGRGAYDIKVYRTDNEGNVVLDENGNPIEWQPIDEGKTVTVSIPVLGVADGEYVNVLHFIDYAPDINGDELIISTENAPAEWLAILQPAIAAYGDGVHVAVEITENVLVSGGMASVQTDSFSVYWPDYSSAKEDGEEDFTVTFTSSGGEDPANEKTYYVTIGETVKFTFTYEGEVYAGIVGIDQDGKYTLTRLSDGKIVKDQDVADSTEEIIEDGWFSDTVRFTEYVSYTFTKESLGLEELVVGELFEIYWEKTNWSASKNPRWTRVMIVGEYGKEDKYDENGTLVEQDDGIRFHSNGGVWPDGGTGEKLHTVVSYEPVSTVPTPTREGYAFTGWNTAIDGSGIPYSSTDNFPAVIANGTVFYAQWEAAAYTITYVVPTDIASSGIWGTQNASHGGSVVVLQNQPSLTGYTFEGWDYTGDGNPDIVPADIVKGYVLENIQTDMTLVSIWTDPIYTVLFDANGGSGAPGAITADKASSYNITIPADIPTYPGQTFTGWNTKADGTGTAYAAGTAYTISGNLTLYAQWKPIYYVVAFINDADTAQTMDSMAAKTYNEYANLTANTFTNSNMTFQGWALTANGTTVDYTNGQNVKISDLVTAGDQYAEIGKTTIDNVEYELHTITLHAVWAETVYTIHYDGNGGTVTNLTQRVIATDDENTPVTINNVATMPQHTFKAWNTKADGTGTSFANNSEYTAAALGLSNSVNSITLYATWYLNVAGYIGTMDTSNNLTPMGTITVDSDGDGEFDDGTYTNQRCVQAIDYNGSIAAMKFTPPEGYKIIQIWEKAERQTVENTATHTYEAESGITDPFNVVVIVAPKSITITFDTDGGTAIDPITQDYGTAVTAPANPSRTGYTFAGWEPEIPDTMPSENITVTAKWTVNSYTVKWIADTTESTVSYKYGATIVVPNDPEKEGYTFTGWSPAVPATMPAENLTFTAQWQIKSYAVKFNPVIEVTNGTDLADQSVPHGGTVTLPTPSPVDTGFAFQGWISDGTTYEAGKTVTITGETTFEADWDPKPYEITYAFAGLPEGTTLPTLDKNGGGYMTSVELTQIATYPSFEGYELVSITAEGATSGEEVEITNNTITMPAENVVVTLTYQPLTYTVTIIGVDPFGNTWLDADGNPLITGSVTLNYNEGTTASLDSVMTVPDGYTTTEKSVQIQWNSNSPVEVIYTKADTCYVTIEWGELVFDYTKRTDWDATTHRYYIPPKTDNSNYVTVTNHALSSFAVNASVSVGIDTAYPTMRTEFSESSDVVGGESAPSASIEKGASKTYWLWLYGSMTEAQANYAASLADGAMIGTCTVTITTQGG